MSSVQSSCVPDGLLRTDLRHYLSTGSVCGLPLPATCTGCLYGVAYVVRCLVIRQLLGVVWNSLPDTLHDPKRSFNGFRRDLLNVSESTV